MKEHTSLRKSRLIFMLLFTVVLLSPKIMVSQSETCKHRYVVVEPSPTMKTVLGKVCSSINECLCVRKGIPFYSRVWMYDTMIVVQLSQMETILPLVPCVCIFDDIPFFIHYSNDISKFFKETNATICADTLFDIRSWDGMVICSYSNIIDDDYYEAKFTFSGDSFHLCCEHPCITEQQNVPNLKPQNIHYSPKSLDKLCIYSPYVDTVSIATVRLSIKFDNIRRMNVVDIKDLTYLWVFKYQTDRYPDKEYFYYDGCEIADSTQFAYYKSQIEEVVHRLRFRVPRRYKRFPKFKQKYGYDDYLITDFRINESEPVVLTLKVLPAFMK